MSEAKAIGFADFGMCGLAILVGFLLLSGCSEDSGATGSSNSTPPKKAEESVSAEESDSGSVGAARKAEIKGPYFAEESLERGVAFNLDSGFRKMKENVRLFPEIMPGGAALFDADGDQDLDLCLLQFGPLDSEREGDRRNRFLLNDGNGRFSDATDQSGLGLDSPSVGIATGDIDGDGDVDLYITNLGPNQLIRNNGDGTFTDITEESGTGHPGWGASAAFLDYDLDGDLDLFATNYIDWNIDNERVCTDWLDRPD